MRLSNLGSALSWKRSLGELSLIVIGVLIALGANSWWDGRQDRAREQVYLQQLLSDTRENEERIERAITADSADLVEVQRFLDSVPDDGPLAGELNLRSRAVQLLTGTYAGLIQSGDLQLLRSDDIRLKVISYADGLTILQQFQELTIAQTLRSIEAIIRRTQDDDEVVGAAAMQQVVGESRLDALHELERSTRSLRCLLEAEFEPVETVDVDPAPASIGPAETADLQATVRFASGLVLEGCEVSWASGDEDVASVDEGVVTGIAEGDATITATFRQASGSAHVSIQPATE